MPAKQTEMTPRQLRIADLCDGQTPSRVIAAKLNECVKYVQKTMLRWNLPRIKQGGATGELNASYNGGRTIDRDGYVLTSAPLNHPHARMRKNRQTGRILEHRLVMESVIGRYLDPLETVDHIDGLRLHNHPSNLRLFSCNAEHLKETITGQVPLWSKSGEDKMTMSRQEQKENQPVDSYDRMKKSGDVRLKEILLAALKLGINSPYLLGSSHHLKKVGIVDFSRSNLARELECLYQQYV